MKQLMLWIFVISNACFSQVTISGKLTDESGNAISGVSILINQVGTDNIIAYDISDSQGLYNISFSSEEEEIEIPIAEHGVCHHYKNN